MECVHRRLLLTIQTAASLFNCFERIIHFFKVFFILKNVKIFSENVILSASLIDLSKGEGEFVGTCCMAENLNTGNYFFLSAYL
ncbi:hypothetical protein T01_7093 [Trichinella spiralis]|uniref:Uncharacterized protein n=1 Tax=Trichinella spiralis TaxID=6334 RepID=A0A0V1BLM1_TRISP|nr:hypothetical protein T01_7093 [Trichinella spiralis]